MLVEDSFNGGYQRVVKRRIQSMDPRSEPGQRVRATGFIREANHGIHEARMQLPREFAQNRSERRQRGRTRRYRSAFCCFNEPLMKIWNQFGQCRCQALQRFLDVRYPDATNRCENALQVQ